MKNFKSLIAMFLLSAFVSAWAWTGSGTEAAPYLIKTTNDLNALATEVNAGNDYSGKYFKLANDIEFTHTTKWENAASSTENNYTAIGLSMIWTPAFEVGDAAFEGIFDGDGKTIRGIRINTDDGCQGLFCNLGASAEVKNVRLADVVISASALAGAIAGHNDGKIRDCTVDSVLIKGDLGLGGIAGENNGTLSGNLAIHITISSEYAYGGGGVPSYGAITNGSTWSLSNNYYSACTFLGVENATDVGVGEAFDESHTLVTYDVSGAVSIHSVTLNEGISITTPKKPIYTDNDKNAYYKSGETCTVTVANEDDVIENITGVTASNTSVTMNIATDKKSATFSMPHESVEITAVLPSTGVGYTVSVPGNFTISEEYATIDGVKYYKPGKTYTLIAKANVIIDEIAGVTASNAQVTVTVADDKKSATFTMPHENVTITATTSEGNADVTLTSAMTEWTDGNAYNVTSDVTIGSRIVINGAVTLKLGAGATLTAKNGIEVSEGNTLTIEGDGTLNATGDSYIETNPWASYNCGRAGIGAENVGTIIINSGNINATGGAGNGDRTHGAAGIGGSYNNTTGGSIIINGGIVNATGTDGGAGIGGGFNNGGTHGLPGSIKILGGQVTATRGYGASGIGGGWNAGNGQASLTLGWTKMTDYIHASSIGSGNDFSSITFVEGKKFAYEGTETVVTASNIVEKDDNGKKIVPLITMTDLSNAVIGNVNTNYTYSGSEISITPVVSLDNNVLTEGEDYTVSYTKGGEPVTAIQKPGVYTLTVTGAGGVFHGSKSFVFSIQGIVNYQAYENGSLTDKPSLAADGYTTVVPSTTTMSAGWYVVSDNVTVSDRISVSGDVHLVLCDGATLTAQTGIGVTDGNSLTIYSQSGNTGKLVATLPKSYVVPFYHAAIGGDRYNTVSDGGTPVKAGSITIHGGIIDAIAHPDVAGIGQAYEGKAGNITLYGGKVSISCDGINCIGIGGDDAVIQLGYARTDDYIQSLGYIGTVTVASDRKFATDDATPVDISGSVINLSSINGKKLTPKTYTVSFSLGYDGGTAPDAQIVYHGLTKAIEPTAPTRTIYSFGGWKNGSTAYDFTAAVTSDLSLKAIWTPDPAHFSVNDAGTEYTIHTAEGWGVFCDILAENDKGYFDGKTVKLDADIGTAENPVTRMAGGSHHDFTGTFDGQGHSLTVNYGSESAPINENSVAPFRNVLSGCIIKNLHVKGDIYTSGKYAAGIVGTQYGEVTISNCHVSTVIHSYTPGDGSHGGLVGLNGSTSDISSITIEGSVFDGKLLTEGDEATTDCGGFVGWINTTVNITNSLYAPAAIGEGETEVFVGTGDYPSSTFGRKKNATVTVTNSYYTRALGTEQGTASRTVTAGEGVTIDEITPVGDATETYTVSSITAYANGITCGGKFYYGSGDQVNLTLSHEDPAGYSHSGYIASAGTLSGNDETYLLTMPENGDVTISRSLAKLLTNEDISISAIDDQTYTGSAICPDVFIRDGDSDTSLVLVRGKHYNVACTNNINASTESSKATLTITGIEDKSIAGYNNFTGSVEKTFNITKVPLTVTAKDKSIVYGEEPANDGVEYSGFVNGETASVLGGSLSYAYNYAKLDNVGSYTITPSGLTADNYEIEFVAGTLTVEPKKLTVTALPDTITYGDEVPSEFNVEYSGFVDNETEDVLKGSLSNSCEYTQYGDAGKYAITPSGLTADNYEIEFVAGKLAVLPKVLTVSALNKTIVYGDEPSNAGVEYDGFAGEENEKSLSGELDFTYGGYKQYGDVGEYDIMPNGLSAKNYKVKFVAGKLTVEPKTVLASGAVQVLEDQDGVRAEIDGAYNGTEALDIPDNVDAGVDVATVIFRRKFTTTGFVTIMLPFDYSAFDLKGVKSVIEFAGMTKDGQGKTAVGMSYVWCSSDVQTALEAAAAAKGSTDFEHCNARDYSDNGKMTAYTPYMVEMESETLEFTDGAKILVTPAEAETRKGDWVFRGTLKKKVWTAEETADGKFWGFAAQERDGAHIGDFVKLKEGAWIPPLRAYMVKEPLPVNSNPEETQLKNAPKFYAPVPSEDLPESMEVVIVSRSVEGAEHTTVIGRINTRTGEIRLDTRMSRDFDLKGRSVQGKAKARGAYYGKKVLVK